jgi:uracil-DNA glycosylase family 4
MNDRRTHSFKELNLLPVWRQKSNHSERDAQSQEESSSVLYSAEDNQSIEESDQAAWLRLKQAVTDCFRCQLSETRTHTVFGVGDENADWLFIGEGPGAKEDETGEPFVGQAGKLLDQMLAAIRLKRGDNVYITNIVKCRPPGNRNPSLNEARQCEPYLISQIELIKPKLIVALGKVAAQNLLKCDDSISSLRGKVHYFSNIPLIVTYHPAYLLRSLPEKAKAWKDLCFANATMQSLK